MLQDLQVTQAQLVQMNRNQKQQAKMVTEAGAGIDDLLPKINAAIYKVEAFLRRNFR